MEFSSVSDNNSSIENNQNLRSLLNEFKDDIIKQITNHVSIKSNTNTNINTGIANVNPNLTKPFTSEEYINLLNKDLPEIFDNNNDN